MNDAPSPTLGQDPGLAVDLGAASGRAGGYRVLARKYRPQSFPDLIGQEPVVRTLTNAFATGRLPQAWILTGVRGVGKTTTARILARALNYEAADGSVLAPTIDMPAVGVHCQAIIESRHVDVVEMDAASHNGVDDVRQINDAVRYAPVTARYKVYILDEVHMLSTQAFNALLKTLEEPPPHVKFVFATTEIRKVPVTVLSRCQRFDLRRVEADVLVRHLQTICGKESIDAEAAALAVIARAAEGSVRDALSLLDQAIAHSGGAGAVNLRAGEVRQMLGLADRARVIDLFEALMRGDMAAALKEVRDQYDSGADPTIILTDLAEFTHFVTRVKIVPAVADDLSLTEAERMRGRAFAAALSMRVLSRAWQMLLKGIEEVKEAPRPLAAAEMVLVRIAYVADLPAPDELIRKLSDEGASGSGSRPGNVGPTAGPTSLASAGSRASGYPSAARGSAAPLREPVARLPEPSAQAAAEPIVSIARFEDLIALAAEKRDLVVRTALERDVRLVRCEDGRLEISLEPGASKMLAGDLARKISTWTGRRWMVVVSAEAGAPTLRSQQETQAAELKRGVAAEPLVQAVLDRFPGAQIVAVRRPNEEPAPVIAPADEDVPPVDDLSAFGAYGRPEDADDDI
jgi:DNA polymerase III subunit gamma/tau